MLKKIIQIFKNSFDFEPTIVNPFNRKSIGGKITLKSRDERREAKIRELISDMPYLGMNKNILDTDNLKNDLSFDSLDCVELTMLLEEKFNIEIDDEDAEKVETVKDVYALVEKYLK